jgi:hypothetical protein
MDRRGVGSHPDPGAMLASGSLLPIASRRTGDVSCGGGCVHRKRFKCSHGVVGFQAPRSPANRLVWSLSHSRSPKPSPVESTDVGSDPGPRPIAKSLLKEPGDEGGEKNNGSLMSRTAMRIRERAVWYDSPTWFIEPTAPTSRSRWSGALTMIHDLRSSRASWIVGAQFTATAAPAVDESHHELCEMPVRRRSVRPLQRGQARRRTTVRTRHAESVSTRLALEVCGQRRVHRC